MRLRMQISMSV